MNDRVTPFWEAKKLEEMTREEWESLCDGCGRCCLHKLQNDFTEEIYYTQIVCNLFDQKTCQCTKYEERSVLVPSCVTMMPDDARNLTWMPNTCAYKLLADGRALPEWHPLITGSRDAMIEKEIAISEKVIFSEDSVPESKWQDYIIAKLE
ncbi:MAG: YcgN family cysteine cluster protein [Gammaproteobacteria bacterium]|nr:YcgN family cysteine cluster protein [Gammaproteobacteria bacterium]